MKALLGRLGNRRRPALAMAFLCAAAALSTLGACSKAPPAMDHKAVMGDEKSLVMYRRFGWELVTSHREDENTTTYFFQRPEHYRASVQDAVAEAGAEAKDKTRLADKDLTEAEKTDGSK